MFESIFMKKYKNKITVQVMLDPALSSRQREAGCTTNLKQRVSEAQVLIKQYTGECSLVDDLKKMRQAELL